MAIQGIGFGFDKLAGWLSKGEAQAASSGQGRQNSAVRETTAGTIRRHVQELLADVPRQGNTLTFADVAAYREQRLEEFQDFVRQGLKGLGVDLSKDLDLHYDANTGKVLAGNHPDKALVERFFEASPELVQEYAQLLQLTKLTESAETKLSPSEMRLRIQSEMMSAWFGENAGDDFFGGSLAMSLVGIQGLAKAYTGLNLRI